MSARHGAFDNHRIRQRSKRSCQRRQMIRNVRAEETMGIRRTSLPVAYPGRPSGKPAPEMIMSTFSSTAAFTSVS